MIFGRQNVLAFVNVHDNDVAAYTPQFWAREGLEILTETMIAANLVHRDFENTLASYGDVVNIHKPGEFKAKRKTDCEDVTVQDVTSEKIQVTLNQHVHTSFLICDGQESMAMQDLIDEFAKPAVIAQARFIDLMVLGQYAQFLNSSVGVLGGSGNAKNDLLEARELLNKKKVPMDNRLGILNPDTETEMLKTDLFIQAQQVGDNGQALRTGSLGMKFGLALWMSQNMPVVLNNQTNYPAAINHGGGYAQGTTGALAVDGTTGVIPKGGFLTIGGVPYRIVASHETTGATDTITLDRALTQPIADNAVVAVSQPGAVNFAGGYPLGYIKEVVVDGFTNPPQVGQAVSFGASGTSPVYSVMEATTTSILLDRPLEENLTDNETVNLGPPGAFNFFFTRDAIALVVRPLAKPKPGTGALSSVINANGLSMRATITYDGRKQGHLVTLDFLCGIKVLRPELGAVLLG